MANYNENTLSGDITTYQRSDKVVIDNTLDKIPTITFLEQILSILPDGSKIITGRSKCSDSMQNPYEEFNLLNPMTDEVLGVARFIDAQVILYSIYRYVADKRDTQQTISGEPTYAEPD